MSCPDVSDFINFCEEHVEADNPLYYYTRFLLYNQRDKEDWSFDHLYNLFCEKCDKKKEIEHYNMSKFIAYEYFMDYERGSTHFTKKQIMQIF